MSNKTSTQPPARIFGRITDAENRALPNLLVYAYDRDMRSEELLGEAVTGRDGKYEIEWDAGQPDTRGKRTADIAIKVRTKEKGSLLYASGMDEVLFNAGPREEINIILRQAIPAETVEYDFVFGEVRALAGKVAVTALQENDQHRDVTFLSKEAEIAPVKIEHLVVAHRLQSESKIDAAFFYALLRRDTLLKMDWARSIRVRLSIGLDTDILPLLYDAALADPKIIQRDVRAAAKALIVADSVAKAVDKYLEQLQRYRPQAEAWYQNEYPKKVQETLGRFVLEDKLGEMGHIFEENKHDLDAFFKKISDPSFFPSGGNTRNAAVTLALGALLGFDTAIIDAVKTARKIKKPEDVRRLAALNKAEWKTALSGLEIGGKRLSKQQVDLHASMLVRKMEREFPTAAYAAQLKRETKPVLKHQPEIADFLDKHADFDLRHSNIDLFLKSKKMASLKHEAMREELKSVQRIFRLVPHYGKTQALLQQNIHSAQGIVAAGESRFVREIAPVAGIQTTEARRIFRQAARTNTAALLIAGELQDTIRAMDVAAIETSGLAAKLAKVAGDFPNLKTLFQGTDTCACEHCRSVYSPAAYLVEILQFLDKRTVADLSLGTSGHSALQRLFDRRPDLGEIDLGCENANTPIPYIDLVCELLEAEVFTPPSVVYTGNLSVSGTTGKISPELLAHIQGLGIPVTAQAQIFGTEHPGGSVTTPYYLRDKKAVCKITEIAPGQYTVVQLRQTLSTAEELAAAPEYVNTAAYDLLKQQKYAFKLPFDLDHTEAKAYFNRFGIARAKLMEDFQVFNMPESAAIAAERLGLTDAERILIVTSKPTEDDQQLIWHAPLQWDENPVITGSVVDYMKRLDHFLDKTGLTFKETELLLSLKFIDPANNLYIQNKNLTCDTAQKEIANLDAAALDRIHRLLRWQKRIGWRLEILQEIIGQSRLGNGVLDDNCLIHAANLLRLSEETGIKLEELPGFYREIPAHEYAASDTEPLYHQVFLNKAKNGFIDERLLPEHFNTTALLSDLHTTLSVCLQVPEGELAMLTVLLSSNVDFGNLSYLFAATRLMRKLKLTAADFLALTELTGIDIQISPAETLAFMQAARIAEDLPFKPSEVKYLLWHESVHLEGRAIKDDRIKQILEGLRVAYQKAFEATKSPFDEKLTVEEQKGALQQKLAQLSGIGEADVKIMLGFVDGNWRFQWTDHFGAPVSYFDLSGAVKFLEAKLGPLFDVSPVTALLGPLDSAVSETTRKPVLESFFTQIAAYQFQITKIALLEQAISSTFKTDLDLAKVVLKYARLKQGDPDTNLLRDLLLSDSLTDTPLLPIDEASFPRQYQSLRLLHKMLPLIVAFKLDNPAIEWYFLHNGGLYWFLWDDIPYQSEQSQISWQWFTDFAQILSLGKTLTPVVNPADAEHPVTFFSLVERITPPASGFLEQYALLTGHDQTNVQALDAYLFPTGGLQNNFNPANWKKLETCLNDLRKLGCSLGQVKTFIHPVLTAAEAATLRSALKARYDEDTWLGTLKEITDAIRPQKRNALAAYLLAVNPDFKNENDLYDYFLVDVEMEACMPSSRIVQAHGAVQLFVQRCLMGLEPKAAADTEADSGWEQWKWMKNYRVWEANRKIFLYPENWIEPELRDDKSFLFEELEKEIQQNELTDFTAEQALIKYLEKLDNIAFLEVMATWYASDTKTMHVFARTKGGDPAIYYYRRFEQERYWTPWEKVDLDITGDHLLAFARNNRLTLAWLVISEEPDPNLKATIPTSSDQGKPIDTEKPKRKLKIQLALSELANNTWQPKKISKEGILTPGFYTSNEEALRRDKYNLLYYEWGQQIWVFSTLERQQTGSIYINGIFDITGCKGYPEPVFEGEKNFRDFLPDFDETWLKTQRYHERKGRDSDDLTVRNGVAIFSPIELLKSTPGMFRLTYPHQFTCIDAVSLLFQYLMHYSVNTKLEQFRIKIPLGTLLPYFMEDSNHAYVIIPGFYKELSDPVLRLKEPVLLKRTASEVLTLIEDLRALYIHNVQEHNQHPEEFIAECQRLIGKWAFNQQLEYGEQFKNMYHPLVCELRTTLYRDGIPALMKRETQLQQKPFSFQGHYQPGVQVPSPYPVENIDFTSDGSYSSYNWELFFHVPFMLATRLTQNQRFEEAMSWFHYIFNPTGALPGTVPQKYWVTKPFFEYQQSDYISQRIDTLLYNISGPESQEQTDLEFAVDQWRIKPFRPHVVARFRPVAYQKAVLKKYIDNLTEWGDYLFRQDTMESIAQATQMYILADKLLGEKPRIIPPLVQPPYETYNQVVAKLDAFGNALIDLENILPDFSALPEGGAELPSPPPVTLSTQYFCIPQNDKMLEYWDRVADRLYKIRHCQNIDGVERNLALFAPPIDPALLVRATAAGLDITAVLAGINAPTPYYRFNVVAQKAAELTNEVRGLGSSLLQALEKKDAEVLSLLRSELEIKVLNAVKDLKILQITEANEQIEVLKRTRKATEERYTYYASIEKIIPKEQLNLDKLSESHGFQAAAQGVKLAASIISLLPDIDLGVSGFGGTPIAKFKIGGLNIGQATNAASDILSFLGMLASNEAARASILGSYERRYDDWKLQERLATLELNSIDKQITAAEIRKEIAATDLKNHDLQIENAQKTDEFMRSKYTNKELYDWMIGQISSVYFQAYQLAHDFAKKAERCYRFELGNDDTFISYGYWDSLKKGLQSADALLHDLKRMEAGYMDKNKREYEITKHVSLALLDPLALIQLRATGSCDFDIPEALFDLDHAGHYFRRTKSVSVSVPCVAGPYTSVSARLSLVKNKYRKNATILESDNGYPEMTENDDRFVYNIGAIQSIATSNAQNDSGVFELNFRDERYLPFEGTGAFSSWRLELPAKTLSQFNYDTINDVVLHIKYTARDGGSALRGAAEGALKAQLAQVKQQLGETGLHVAINVRQDLPEAWHLLKQTGAVNLKIDTARLPYLAQLLNGSIDSVMFIAKSTTNPRPITINYPSSTDQDNITLSEINGWGNMWQGQKVSQKIALDAPFKLSIASTDLEELILVVKYAFGG